MHDKRPVFSHFSTPASLAARWATGRHRADCRIAMLGAAILAWQVVALSECDGSWSQWFAGATQQTPHPAVVRISVQEEDGIAQGSGTLVDVREQYGLVVTNWHVICDRSGSIQVAFPDGFSSAARVLSVDRDWDLAALMIWRPSVKPVPFATRAPEPGDWLSIAGYGPGNYRSVKGRCTQYVAPSDHHPFEMVELSANARQGDSGGPIFNRQGQLAGVLFGSDGGTTSGSFAGRVQRFLNSAWPPSVPLPNPDPMTAGTVDNPTLEPGVWANGNPHGTGVEATAPDSTSMVPLPSLGQRPAVAQFDRQPPTAPPPKTLPTRSEQQPISEPISWEALTGETMFEKGKSVLATIGACVVLLQIGRLLVAKR